MVQVEHTKRLMTVDLNLLVVLNVLHDTGSTAATAVRIGRTQSAVSLALGRLRHLFNDPLFVRERNGLKPTALCLALRVPIQQLLTEVHHLIVAGTDFEPQTDQRRAVFAYPELGLPFALQLKEAIQQSAPALKLELQAVDLQTADYADGVTKLIAGEIDLLLCFYRTNAPTGLKLIELAPQSWVTLAREAHPIGEAPSLAEWCNFSHIQVKSGETGRNPIGDALASLGAVRTIGLSTNNFLQALYAVAQSNMLLTTMSPIVKPLSDRLGLRTIAVPIQITSVPTGFLMRDGKTDAFSSWLGNIAQTCWTDAGQTESKYGLR